MFKKIISLFLSLSLIITQPIFAQGVAQLNLAQYLGQARPAAIDSFQPTQLRYFSYDNLNNSFRILLDKGDAKDIKDTQLKQEAKELMDYFLIGLALPNDAFWVNLRPDSPDNIIDPELEKTDLGRILLEADLQLKKDTAGLTSPQTSEGKAYWDKLYKKAGELFGTENITIPTITRPWIVPGEIIVRESGNSAYIYKATLKIMLEEDYLTSRGGSRTAPTPDQYTFSDPRLKELNQYSTQLIKEAIIPKLTKEVNSAKRYAKLRQAYYSLVLSRWFKQKYSSLRSTRASARQGISMDYIGMIDSGNLTNLIAKEPYDKLTYFKQYQESFAKGEYNLKEPVYTSYGQSIRAYMSGGFDGRKITEAISGANTKVAGSSVEQQLLNKKNMAGFDNNLEIVKPEQPNALAASPVGEIKIEAKKAIENAGESLRKYMLSDEAQNKYNLSAEYIEQLETIKLWLWLEGAVKFFNDRLSNPETATDAGRIVSSYKQLAEELKRHTTVPQQLIKDIYAAFKARTIKSADDAEAILRALLAMGKEEKISKEELDIAIEILTPLQVDRVIYAREIIKTIKQAMAGEIQNLGISYMQKAILDILIDDNYPGSTSRPLARLEHFLRYAKTLVDKDYLDTETVSLIETAIKEKTYGKALNTVINLSKEKMGQALPEEVAEFKRRQANVDSYNSIPTLSRIVEAYINNKDSFLSEEDKERVSNMYTASSAASPLTLGMVKSTIKTNMDAFKKKYGKNLDKKLKELYDGLDPISTYEELTKWIDKAKNYFKIAQERIGIPDAHSGMITILENIKKEIPRQEKPYSAASPLGKKLPVTDIYGRPLRYVYYRKLSAGEKNSLLEAFRKSFTEWGIKAADKNLRFAVRVNRAGKIVAVVGALQYNIDTKEIGIRIVLEGVDKALKIESSLRETYIEEIRQGARFWDNTFSSAAGSPLGKFVTGGVNSNETIDASEEIGWTRIEVIEYRGRPEVYGSISKSGFKDILKKDNTFVLGNNLSHQRLADPLLKVLVDSKDSKDGNKSFEYNNQKFMIKTIYERAWSIFNDKRWTHFRYIVTNTITHKTISFSGLLPYYINDYGFYGGDEAFRLEPKDIIDFFGITASSGLTSESQPSVPFGGIDFTDQAMRIGLEPMGSFADLKLVLPEVSNAAAIDLDNEFKQIQLMASSGIRPSDIRILEFAAACYYRGEFGTRMGEITSCLQQAHFLDERLGRESSEALRLATMLPEVM